MIDRRLAAAALLATTILTACESDPPQTTPSSAPPPSTSRPTTSINPSAQAPPVKQPLDATRFRADACQSITEFQRQSLKLPDVTSQSLGPFCRFTTPKLDILVELSILSGSLGSFYQNHYYSHRWNYWEPTEIDGYPAVVYQDTPDRAKKDCEVVVGISDTSSINVRYGLADAEAKGQNPCVEGRHVASAVLSTIIAAK